MDGNDCTLKELEQRRRLDILKYRKDLLEERIKDAYADMVFSYQFFHEHRELYSNLCIRHEEIDRELAETDGRLKKCKPKLEPNRRNPPVPKVTKEKLKEMLENMTPENRGILFAQLMKSLEEEK